MEKYYKGIGKVVMLKTDGSDNFNDATVMVECTENKIQRINFKDIKNDKNLYPFISNWNNATCWGEEITAEEYRLFLQKVIPTFYYSK